VKWRGHHWPQVVWSHEGGEGTGMYQEKTLRGVGIRKTPLRFLQHQQLTTMM